jgi:hypothetical protein
MVIFETRIYEWVDLLGVAAVYEIYERPSPRRKAQPAFRAKASLSATRVD